MTIPELQAKIEAVADIPADQLPFDAEAFFTILKSRLNSGAVRAAEKVDGVWQVNTWVKKGILLGFKLGKLVDMSIDDRFHYFDKHTFPLRRFSIDSNVRIVPGGTSIRDACFVASGVICMPPAYINVGAFVDEGTLVDSHALVGSCAQIGKRVHLSAAAQIGGVLEPVGAMPVVVEDDAFIGGNCGVYEGTRIGTNAVLAAGVVLTRGSAVYDLVNETVITATADHPLIIPEGAVVVAGTRAVTKSVFAREHGLSVASPLIVKYRDARTSASTALEEALR
jgi:2,3,4,5-tetrahydropyridine-2-carboxylate N-succinyltransferase